MKAMNCVRVQISMASASLRTRELQAVSQQEDTAELHGVLGVLAKTQSRISGSTSL